MWIPCDRRSSSGWSAPNKKESNPLSERQLDVLIMGGGIGGLCLAQGLRKAGVSATVYERDKSPISRAQGFQIHEPDGQPGAL